LLQHSSLRIRVQRWGSQSRCCSWYLSECLQQLQQCDHQLLFHVSQAHKPGPLHVLKGQNSDSGLPVPGATFEGMGDFQVRAGGVRAGE
jgi:hypothetical protein